MPHHPSAERPSTDADQTTAALTELCKAIDHVREALWLLPDTSPEVVRIGSVRAQLRRIITEASNGRIAP